MSTPHTPRLEELLPAYALGALEGDELRELEEHLAGGCAECRRQIALWQGDLEALAAEVEPVEPSDTTRARILRLAGSVERAPAAALAPPRRTPWWMVAAAAALLVLAVWGLLGRSRMEGQVRTLEAERDRLRRQVEELSQEVGRMRTDVREAKSLAAERDRLQRQVEALDREMGQMRNDVLLAKQDLQILAAPGVKSVALAGLGRAPGAQGHTYVNPVSRDALFYAFDLPALPADKTYQLWFIAAGKPVSAGTFAVGPRGTASLRVERVADVRQIQAWAVTVEPRGGVPQPTGDFVLKGT